jgi:hypothetical protein
MQARRAVLVVATLAAQASADGYKKLDSVKALASAKAKGLRLDVVVPYPVVCPKISKTSVDLSGLKAETTGLGFSLEALLRDDIGIAEVVAVLGPPVLCDHQDDSPYLNMYLATKANNVEIETKDGDLIGVVVQLDKPLTMDLKTIAKTFGAPVDYRKGLSARFDTAAFAGGLLISTDAKPTASSARVSEIILRRTSKLRTLPRSYTSEADVARLVAMSSAIKPMRIADYWGPIGEPLGGELKTFPDRSNLSKATLRERKLGKVEVLRAVEISFAKPIKSTPASLVATIAAAANVAAPKVTKGTKTTTITLPAATIVLTFADDALTRLSLTRK